MALVDILDEKIDRGNTGNTTAGKPDISTISASRCFLYDYSQGLYSGAFTSSPLLTK